MIRSANNRRHWHIILEIGNLQVGNYSHESIYHYTYNSVMAQPPA